MTQDPFSVKQLGESLGQLLAGPRHPDQEFVCGGATYGEIYALAAGLRRRLGQHSGHAAICLAVEDKALVAAALLATLSGGPPLLLPHALSLQGLEQLHERTRCTLAVCDLEREAPAAMRALTAAEIAGVPWSVAEKLPATGQLLSIFTGGSTGPPRLWSKTVANLFCEGFFLARHFAVREDDTILATIPPYHIYGLLYAVIMPLVAGGRVMAGAPSFPNELAACPKHYQATILAAVPAHYRVLRDRPLSLRLAFSSAGMLDSGDAQEFGRHNPGGIVEVYGSTETGGIATRIRALGEEHFTPFSLVAWRQVEGQLAVASPYLSPELPVDDDGFFRTSDRIEATGDGGFYLKGRSDAVTKVGGKRVDLEEIGRLLKEDETVVDCVVLALPEPSGREHRICALVEGEQADCQQLLKKLGRSLEPYALPKRLKKVAKIPMTGSGKYDRATITRLLENP